jgi:SPP1 gp7 family putative phage head morphogenesis protein
MFTKLMAVHAKKLIQVENDATKLLLRTYQEAQVELTAKLKALDEAGKGLTFTAQHLHMIKIQVDSALTRWTGLTTGRFRNVFVGAIKLGFGQTVAEIADIERRLGDKAIAERIAGIFPAIPVDAVAAIADPLKLLLFKFRGTVETDVSKQLAQSVLQGESIQKAARRLKGVMDGEKYQLLRIARTEINNAANFGHLQAINRVNEDFSDLGEMKKQWSSHLDGRTSQICRHLNGDVKEEDQNFAAYGWSGLYPPAHPNCRSRCNPYMDHWGEGKQQRTDEQKATDEAAYRKKAA